MQIINNKKILYIAGFLIVMVFFLIFVFSRPLAVEKQVQFFEQANSSTEVIDFEIQQVGNSRFFNCLDVCNSVQVKFNSAPISLDAFNSNLDAMLGEHFDRKYEYSGRLFYDPDETTQCELIKRVQNLDLYDSCDSVQPFWQSAGSIAYEQTSRRINDCDVLTVEYRSANYTESVQSTSTEEYAGSISCNRNEAVDSFSNERSLMPTSCMNYNVCFSDQTKVKKY